MKVWEIDRKGEKMSRDYAAGLLAGCLVGTLLFIVTLKLI